MVGKYSDGVKERFAIQNGPFTVLVMLLGFNLTINPLFSSLWSYLLKLWKGLL